MGLAAAREYVVKRPDFLCRASWVRHVVDLPKREKLSYLHRFPSRLSKILNYLEHVKWFNNVRKCCAFVSTLNPAIVIADPKLYPHINHPRKIPENMVKRRHEKILALLADNIAYYTYWITEVRKKPRELKRILK